MFPPATAPSSTAVSRHFHPPESTFTRCFLAGSTSNGFSKFASFPWCGTHCCPCQTPTRLRCSLPSDSVFDMTHSPTCATIADYVTTLPTWERDLLVLAIEKPLATPLYQRLLPKNATLLVAVMAVPFMAPSVRYSALTRGYPMHSYRTERYGRISQFLFLTHYRRYLDIHPPKGACVSLPTVIVPVF